MTLTTKILATAGLLLLAFGAGRCSAPGAGPSPSEEVSSAADPAQPETWTCPMHAPVRLSEFGPCPICGMDLVLQDGDVAEDPSRIPLTPAARELAHIETALVRREIVTRPVRMVGKVDYDETRVQTISARVAGRLDRLFVDYTGVRVEQGDHLVWLYSPDLLSAQEELLAARMRLSATEGEASEFLAASNRRAYEAAWQKLVLWGLTEEQVAEVEERGTAADHVMLTSPASGVVIEKALDVGAYVETGTRIYRIADLDHLWVQLDAYEQDLGWLRYGQDVVLEAEALRGETFRGRLTFIDPIVDEATRTAQVRVHVDNVDGRLKPGMFVRAVVEARIGTEGALLDRDLAGKWVSPMHPEVIKDGPGPCDVCGMDLVPAEQLGLTSSADRGAPLVVPASAVLVTGRRAVVYVAVLDVEDPTYEGRVVTLGPRAGDQYVVRQGLAEGERVVVNGAFRLDSAMQIRAQPSMMSQPAEQLAPDESSRQLVRAALRGPLDLYLALQTALAADDPETTAIESVALERALAELDSGLISDEGVRALTEAADAIVRTTDWDARRAAFSDLSNGMIELVRTCGNPGASSLHRMHCPMALDFEGATWLQIGEELRNPYFGAEMLRCGTVEEVWSDE